VSTTQNSGFPRFGSVGLLLRDHSRVFCEVQDPGPFGTYGRVSIFLELLLKFLAIQTVWVSTQNFGKTGEKDCMEERLIRN
jgi:hypothetical protein